MRKIMKKMIFIFLILCLNLNAQTMKLCGDPNYPPFNWAQDGKILGVGPEVITLIMQEIGIRVDVIYDGNWARCQRDIKEGHMDIFTAGYKTQQRKTYAVYTNVALKDDPQVVLVKKGREFEYNQWRDLIGKVGGHILGSSLGNDFDKFIKENIKMHYVSSRLQVFKMLEKERVDFEVVGLWPALIQMQRLGYHEKLTPLKKPVSSENMYMAISKKSPFLKYMTFINTRLKEMHENGTIDKIIKKHIDSFSIEQ